MKSLWAALAVLALACGSAAPSFAQAVSGAVVVATCGTPPVTYTAGSAKGITQDTTGTLCTAAGGGGGGGGAVTVANGADVAEGTTTDAACATDNGTCTIEALLKRENQRLTTVNTTLGTPLQAGGTVTVTDGAGALNVIVDSGAVAATQSGTWTVQPGNTANTTAWKVDGSAVTQPVSGTVTVTDGAGALNVIVDSGTVAATQSGTWTVTSANGATLTPYVLEPAASDNHATIKNGAGTLNFVHSFNNSATINYLRFYDAGTGFNGCNSATNLIWEMHIPANTSDAGFVENLPAQGLPFTAGLSICVTSGYGQTNTTAATASAISISALYK